MDMVVLKFGFHFVEFLYVKKIIMHAMLPHLPLIQAWSVATVFCFSGTQVTLIFLLYFLSGLISFQASAMSSYPNFVLHLWIRLDFQQSSCLCSAILIVVCF